MGLSQEEVIAVLKQHAVEFQSFDHEPVMTCDAQARTIQQHAGRFNIAAATKAE